MRRTQFDFSLQNPSKPEDHMQHKNIKEHQRLPTVIYAAHNKQACSGRLTQQ